MKLVAFNEPTFWQPVCFALLGGISIGSLLQVASMHRLAEALPSSGTASLDLLVFLVTEPLVHIVVVPACFFIAYTFSQVIGYRAELSILKTGKVGPISGSLVHVSGRNDALNYSGEYPTPLAYQLIQRDHSRLLRPVSFGVGMLTMLGLLGTIIGLSLALQDLPDVMVAGADVGQKKKVLKSLGFAFATTIIGILGSLTLSLAELYLRNMADRATTLVENRRSKTEG